MTLIMFMYAKQGPLPAVESEKPSSKDYHGILSSDLMFYLLGKGRMQQASYIYYADQFKCNGCCDAVMQQLRPRACTPAGT